VAAASLDRSLKAITIEATDVFQLTLLQAINMWTQKHTSMSIFTGLIHTE
jgi:hypothetical protein